MQSSIGNSGQRQWVSSAGGPLVLLPSSLSSSWTGARQRGVAASDDYAVACRVSGYVGVISKDGTDVLVLGDEPLRTTALASDVLTGFVRWVAAESSTAVEAAIHDLRPEQLGPALEMHRFSVQEPIWNLADAGVDGRHISERGAIRVALDPGIYDVSVHEYFPSRAVRLLVIVLRRQ
ncbi:hypothetical protein FGE12_19100 [Aggregicoccus sp. 17bor-14]|uniref:Imm21 family immunity protein n=1 Tax=Myxococcaceae TaxID=31 RepID=UPI00129CD00B|nr:hypothetical protein [Simulacricoccus sp. 17bor-14]MRI90259.1 hypothetical protein [Aggregicoccus sp. 17bor-14]